MKILLYGLLIGFAAGFIAAYGSDGVIIGVGVLVAGFMLIYAHDMVTGGLRLRGPKAVRQRKLATMDIDPRKRPMTINAAYIMIAAGCFVGALGLGVLGFVLVTQMP